MTRDANILVVDDDREIRTMLSAYLTKNGLSATAVADGEETRRALQQADFDLIVLDLMLPYESGLESSRNAETGGTGLGLSIARDIAQAHGGNPALRNRSPQGLEAVLTLPRGV